MNFRAMTHQSVALLQHAPNEGGGIIEETILEMKIPLHRIEIFSENEIPPITATHLVVMGGTMSVNDEQDFSWLIHEKKLIQKFIGRRAPVLGICLGAQLIASAGGAKVYPCIQELGWSRITTVLTQFNQLPDRFMAFQMHGETFELPRSAELICTGDQVHNQALSWGSALGFQFHLELTGEMIRDWLSGRSKEELEAIIRENKKYLSRSQTLCRRITEKFLAAPPRGFSWIGKG
jgi:GMP synthase (glutamine-hydrolysing)